MEKGNKHEKSGCTRLQPIASTKSRTGAVAVYEAVGHDRSLIVVCKKERVTTMSYVSGITEQE
jgi:hypothetical protein